MGTRIEYIDTTQMYATNYIRNSKAVAVLWAIFTICYAIISCVAFSTPDWIGDSSPENIGRLGLWQVCQKDFVVDVCQKRWENILAVPSFPFQMATVFVGLSVVTAFLTIFLLAFMLFLRSSTVFHMCGWAQILSAIFMILGCVSFPLGWNSEESQSICGVEADRFVLGDCEIKWAFALAIISCIDAIILATLAFILATRNITLQPEPMYQSSTYKDGVSLGSRKSLNLQPVLLVTSPHHGDDTISQFSSQVSNHHNNRINRPDYHNSINQFQL